MTTTRLLAAVVLAASLAGCTEPSGDGGISAAEATRRADGAVVITWSGGPADIYRAQAPDASAPMEALTRNDTDNLFETTAADGARAYYLVAAKGGRRGLFVAERLLPLEGGRNFRDLGGYRTEDGRHVRWGKIYRSGMMAGLTDRDYSYLSTLGIQVVCDFRTDTERANEPTDWRAEPKAEYVSWPGEMPSDRLRKALSDPAISGETMRAAMIGLYGELPELYRERYAGMFARLAAGEIPLAFNCTAGKDRTGLAAALVLSALGVPRQTILEDYTLSDVYVDYKAELQRAQGAGAKPNALTFFAKLPPDAVDALFRSDPAYLEAAFARIEKDHGSVEAYLRDALAVSETDLASIRAALLE